MVEFNTAEQKLVNYIVNVINTHNIQNDKVNNVSQITALIDWASDSDFYRVDLSTEKKQEIVVYLCDIFGIK
jgi:hypothetical protein